MSVTEPTRPPTADRSTSATAHATSGSRVVTKSFATFTAVDNLDLTVPQG